MAPMNSVEMLRDPETGIKYRQWIASDSSAVVILIHGLGAHSARWQSLGEFFIKRNISCYGLELKGFGETEETEGHVDSFDVYYQDIFSLWNIVKRTHGKERIFLLGESLGGLIAFLAVVRDPGRFDGLIGFSPAFKGTLKFSFWSYLSLPVALLINPQKQFHIPFKASMCTRDFEYINQMDKDVREVRVASARMLWNIVQAQKEAFSKAKNVSCPVLFLLSGNDQLVDNQATQTVFSLLNVEMKRMQVYDQMYHALSIDLDREKVFAEIVEWVLTGH